MKKVIPKGFNCSTCARYEAFPMYVYAHGEDPITFTCDCGAKHSIIMGHAMQIKKGKKEKNEKTTETPAPPLRSAAV